MRITFDSPVIPIIIIVAILALIFGISSYFHKKRLEAMNNAAVRMGFSFESKGDRGFIEQLLVFKSFHQGHSQKANNVLKGRRNGWNLTIFDFSYVIGGGNGFIRHSQTVAIVSLGLEIPSFYLTKKTFIHRLGSYRDIDFEFAQNFSKNYHLLGSDEEAIRKLFSSNILTFFEGLNPKYTVEAINGELAIFLPNKKIKPVEIDNFVQKVSQIATVFHRALERSSN